MQQVEISIIHNYVIVSLQVTKKVKEIILKDDKKVYLRVHEL